MADASDYMALFGGDEGVTQDKAAALANAIRQRRTAGMMLGLSGDPAMSGVGQELTGQADKLDTGLLGAAQHRAQQAVESKRYEVESARAAAAQQHWQQMEDLAAQRLGLQKQEMIPTKDVMGNTTLRPKYGRMLPGATDAAGGTPTPVQAGGNLGAALSGTTGGGVKDIADAIESGKRPPETSGLTRQAGTAVAAELARRGFDMTQATNEWKATQKHLSTLNGPQQERLRQAISFAEHQLGNIDDLYNQWQQVGPASGFRVLNRAALAGAKQMGGQVGAVAQALEGQINDLTGEIGNIYMGGNSPTDHALALAKENLQADWDEPTFKKSLELLKNNIKLRHNAMLTAPVGGVAESRYYKPGTPEPTQPAVPGGGKLAQVKTKAEAMALPPGTHFLDPNGVERVR